MRKEILSICFAFTFILAKAQVTDPMVTSWWFNTTNATYNSIVVNVEAIYYTATKVYVKSSGVPSYYADNTTLFDAQDKTNVFILPRTQTVGTSATRTYLRDQGNVAVFIDGSVAFSPCDGKSYNSAGVWHQLAYKFESGDFDSYLGHSNPSGTYHHHVNPTPLYTNTSTVHSPIIGYAFDGYPIYGPYGYTTAMSATSGISRMKTSWKVRSMTTRTTLPDGSTAASSGPTIASQALGKYFEDYEYSSGYGDLDQYNGRTCVTPEYPSGTYAYFITKDASGNPEFPYIIGDYFYGVRELGNMGPTAGNNTVPTGATLYSSTALPIELTHFEAVTKDCDVQLKWSSAIETNFDYFEIEYSDNAKDFQVIGKITAKGNDSRYTLSHNPLDGVSYYRLKMVDKDGSVEYSKIIANQLQCGLKNVKIDVFPNPVANELKIDLQSNTQHKIFIYDIFGKIIYNASANDVTKIDFSGYPSGSYVVEIINNDTGNGLMKKIIKQ